MRDRIAFTLLNFELVTCNFELLPLLWHGLFYSPPEGVLRRTVTKRGGRQGYKGCLVLELLTSRRGPLRGPRLKKNGFLGGLKDNGRFRECKQHRRGRHTGDLSDSRHRRFL